MSTLTIEEQAVAPSTPSANKVVVYALPEGLLYAKDDAGTERVITVSTMTSSLGADVNLSTAAQYFTGPQIAQGTSGTWFVSGTVTIQAGAANNVVYTKLWDGSTVVASCANFVTANNSESVALSGYLANPAGNLRISARDITATDGKIIFNATGNSKDSTITGIRIV